MGQPIEITRTDLSVSALRALAGKTDDGAPDTDMRTDTNPGND